LTGTAAPTAGFPCRLCGGRDLRLYYTLGNEGQCRYYRCERCTLVNYDLAGGLDQTQYTAEWIDPADDSLRKNHDKDQSFRFLQRFVEPPVSFLDIGCGTGRLLYLARRAGWDVKGLELSASMAARVSAALGVPVAVGDFLAMDPDPEDLGRFDAVALRHVLEHLPDGRLAMLRIARLLRPGGVLLLEMPNVESLSKRMNRLLVRTGLHRRRFPADFQAGHCNEYCRSSMDYLARATGFELVRWETYSKKPLANWFLSRVPIGTKARALLRFRGQP
jgi:SAM-dependent methyltransferase